jgi:hypothetical protein
LGRCGGNSLRLWAVAWLLLVAWFFFSALALYGAVPSSLVYEALRQLRGLGLGRRGDVAAMAAAIFLNNVRLVAVFAVPVLGHVVGLFSLTLTAAVGRAAAETLAQALGRGWVVYFLRFIVLTPFFPLEMLAYAIAAAESFAVLRHRCLRRYVAGIAAAVAVLAAAAVVEAFTIAYYPLPGRP